MDAADDPFDGDEDAALRYAIALSLQEAGEQVNDDSSGSTKKQKKIAAGADDAIEISDSGDEDDGSPPAKARSGRGKKKGGNADDNDRAQSTTATATATAAQSQSQSQIQGAGDGGGIFATLGLDRKKMEEERIARASAAKRKAVGLSTDGDGGRATQRFKTDHPAKNPSVTGSSAINATSGSIDSQESLKLPFPKGVVKKTWAKGYPRQGDDIKIEEVFQKDQLQLAVLSSFQWDDDWLLSKIDIRTTKMVCIAYAASEAQKEEMRANVPRDRIRFTFPPMGPTGNMHSKLQLLKFPGYLRIVIPTGNLVAYDWGETGVMENMVFLIDLPFIADPESRPSQPTTAFGQELVYFLEASELSESLIATLARYDFSETDQYRFVHTIGGAHSGDKWRRTGYCGLGRAVKSLGLDTTLNIELDLVVASLGSINKDLVSGIYNAAQGDDGLKEYENRTGKGAKKKSSENNELDGLAERFRIYFPSHDTVVASRGGRGNGGTICLQKRWWDSATFPRQMVRDCKNVRAGLLMHSKMLFVRQPRDGKLHASWAYVGSANLSESAWGRLVKDKTSGQPKLNCRNWECGVLIPIAGTDREPCSDSSVDDTAEVDSSSSWSSGFKRYVPVPMTVPGEAYGRTNSKQPWLFMERRV